MFFKTIQQYFLSVFRIRTEDADFPFVDINKNASIRQFSNGEKFAKRYHIPLTPHIMVIQGCLPYTNNPGGNLVHEHNSLELGVVGQ